MSKEELDWRIKTEEIGFRQTQRGLVCNQVTKMVIHQCPTMPNVDQEPVTFGS
jgi:hypothetical protein